MNYRIRVVVLENGSIGYFPEKAEKEEEWKGIAISYGIGDLYFSTDSEHRARGIITNEKKEDMLLERKKYNLDNKDKVERIIEV
jgi:hypothetical protein